MNIQNSGAIKVLSRTEATEYGLFRFNTGRPCKADHFSERYVSNRQCIACNAIKARHREHLKGVRDPSFRMYRSTLRRAGMALRGHASPSQAVGCDHHALRDHIAGQFSLGMRWEKYRQWEVDHIRPLSSAHTWTELIGLCHYSNLQPMWRSDNRRKGGA